jgi:non-heme chloroperoxidase
MGRASVVVLCLTALFGWATAPPQAARSPQPALKIVAIGDGLALHYVEHGHGAPVVFVHGSLADYSHWTREVEQFSSRYRAIAYSRRYNWPNNNAIRPGHSAVQDADDLAAFIKARRLGRVHVIGHSYGAYTALFLATRHPDLLRTVVFAEPPAVPLLAHLPLDQAEPGRAALATIETQVKNMQDAWRAGDREQSMRIFFTWNTGNPLFWDQLPEGVQQGSRRNFREWDAVLGSGELFPVISPQAIRRIDAPALVVSGADTTTYLATVAAELTRLLQPRGTRHVVIPRAGHVMFGQQPAATREAIFDFLDKAIAP